MRSTPRAWEVDGPSHGVELQLRRLGQHPGGAWSLSWLALFAGGVWLDRTAGPVEAVASALLGAAFAALTWLGALAFAGRPAPLWILPAALAFGIARGVLLVAVGPTFADPFALLFEPWAVLAAAALVWSAALLDEQPGLRLLLTAGLVGVAALEVVDGLGPVAPPLAGAEPLWYALAPITALFEVTAMWAWIARRELRLERAEQGQRELESEVGRERRANELLRRKEAWLFDFFETAPDLLLVLSPVRLEILRCNRRFSETLGYPRRALVGRALAELMDPEAAKALGPLLASGRRRLRNVQLHLRRQDGSELVVLANLALREGSDGASEVRGVFHDVTRLERAQVFAPAASKRVLAEEAPVGLFHADSSGRCAYANASFCELTGWTPEQARERSWLSCIHPDDRCSVEQAWDEALRRGGAFRLQHRVCSASGATRHVITEGVPVSEASVEGFAASITVLPYGAPVAAGADTSGRRPRPDRDRTGRA